LFTSTSGTSWEMIFCATLDDGGLAHAGLADQHRVVLSAAGQDLDDALDLLAHDR
jgi:hypothetical protein